MKKHFVFKELSPLVHYFNVHAAVVTAAAENTESEEQLPDLLARGHDGFEWEQIDVMITAGIMVDDDNKPSPENVPNVVRGELTIQYQE